MKRTHKPYQEYFLVAKGNQGLPTDNADFITGNAVNLGDGQIGILDVKTNKLVKGSDVTVANYPAIKLVAGTPTSADFSKNYGWHIGEVKPFLETPIIDGSHTVQSVTASLTPVQSNSAVYIDGVSVPVASVAATSSVPASVNTYAVNILFRSVRKDRDYGNNIDKLITSYDTPTTLVGSNDAEKKSYVLAKLIGRINAQSKLNNLQPQWANIAAKKHVIALGINLDGTGTGTAITGIKTGDSINVMTTTNGTLAITVTAGMVQTLHNFIQKELIVTGAAYPLAEIITVDVDTVNGGDIDGILLVALDHDTAVAYDDIYGVKPTIDVTVGGFTSYTTTTVSSAIEAGGSGRLFKIAFDERAFAQYGNHQLTGFADELIKTPSYIDETKSYSAYIIDLYNKDEKFDDSIHHQTRIWILLETTLNTSTATADAGIIPTITETTLVTDLNTALGPWLNGLTPGYNANNTGIGAGVAGTLTITSVPFVSTINTTNTATVAQMGSGVAVAGLNLTGIATADVSIINTSGAVVSSTVTAINSTSFTLTSTITVGNYFLKVTEISETDAVPYVTFKRFAVTA
jgi:hypothetical protein